MSNWCLNNKTLYYIWFLYFMKILHKETSVKCFKFIWLRKRREKQVQNYGFTRSIWPLCSGFSKLYRLKRGWNPVFVTFNVTISHIFPENFIDIPQAVQKKNFSYSVSYFHRCSSMFWIFWHFLVTKNLITSAYNSWCQHFFTFNIL